MTTIAQNTYRVGGTYIVVLDIAGGGAGGALTDEVITLRPSSLKLRSLFNIEGIPGAGDAEPSAHNITIKDAGGVTVVSAVAGPTTAKIEIDPLGSRTNYWTMLDNLSISVDDIGAGNTVKYRLIFT